MNCLFLFLFIVLFIDLVNADKLRFVQAIWRHGDRGPSKLPYPRDLNNETAWPRGWNELTSIGVEQMNELGRFFRTRYGLDFLGNEYKDKDISLQSSKSHRALDSAKAFLEGFCPFDSLTIKPYCPLVLPSIKNERGDPLLKPTSFDCPAYKQKASQQNNQLHEDLTLKYKDLFNFLATETGYGPNITLHEVTKLNDLNREIAHGLRQPDWVYKIWPQYGDKTTLELVTELKRIERTSEFNKPELAYLRGGFLLADWLQRGVLVANGKQSNPSKMLLYSSHDGTLQSLMYALQIADGTQIPYSAAVIMEIYEDDAKKFYVKLLYRHDGKLHQKKLPKCELKCNLNDFVSQLNSTAIYSIELLNKQCELKDISSTNLNQASSGTQSFALFSLLPIIFFKFMFEQLFNSQ